MAVSDSVVLPFGLAAILLEGVTATGTQLEQGISAAGDKPPAYPLTAGSRADK